MTEQQHDAGTFDRRSFMRRMAIGGFVIPAIASFKLDSLARAGTFEHCHPNQTYGNQFYDPYHGYGNQTRPHEPCHGYPNQ